MQDYNWNYNETTKIVTTGAPWHDSHSASVKKLVVEDGITSIGNDAFSDCESLVSAELAEGITSIGDGAFTGCYDLEKINIPNSVTSIGYDAFDSCWTLPSLELPSGLSKLESSAVSFTAIKELTVPHGVKVVDSYLAAYNDNLTTVTLEEGVEEIWHRAFWGCEKLNNITIPRSVKKIEGEAFLECTSLKSVTISKNCNVASNAFPSTVQINYYD